MMSINIMSLVAIGGASLGACALLIIIVQSFFMRREFEVVGSISLRTGRRVKRVEEACAGVADRVELVELRGSVPSFDQAIDSARRGTDSGRLTQQFGLSRVEPDLVTRLHGRRTTA
jgi:hypothetical protein